MEYPNEDFEELDIEFEDEEEEVKKAPEPPKAKKTAAQKMAEGKTEATPKKETPKKKNPSANAPKADTTKKSSAEPGAEQKENNQRTSPPPPPHEEANASENNAEGEYYEAFEAEFDGVQSDQEAQRIVMNHILWSMGMGLIPFPIIDVAAVTAVQLDMLKQLAAHYDVDFSKSSGKTFISSLAGSTLAALGGSMIKGIPGIGSIIGGISQAVLSGASTFAVGQVAARHFYEGGTFINFRAEDFKDYYKNMFMKGKEVAENLRKRAKGEKPKSSPTSRGAAGSKKRTTETRRAKTPSSKPPKHVVDRLNDLVKLKEKGILSEEEFQKMKTKLINDF